MRCLYGHYTPIVAVKILMPLPTFPTEYQPTARKYLQLYKYPLINKNGANLSKFGSPHFTYNYDKN